MKYRTGRYFGFALPLFLCSQLPGQPAQCTQDTVVGTYAIATQGSMLAPSSSGAQPSAVPAASLAILSIDAQGSMSGSGMGAVGSTVAPLPALGSIQVNSDCTAVFKTSIGTTSLDVILDEGKEIRGLMFQGPGSIPMILGNGRRISRIPSAANTAQCSAADVHGVYQFTYQGTYIIPQPGTSQSISQSTLMIGLASIDYQGHLSGSGRSSLGGNSTEFTIQSGQLNVNPDCSTTAHMSVQAGALADEGESWMVVLEGGDEMWAIQTSSTLAKPVVTGVWKRISPIPSVQSGSAGPVAQIQHRP
jgi:hypothetical protein